MMLKFSTLLTALLFFHFSYAQEAPNFTADDCDNVNHDLYTELDEGKVIVLNWIMPCGSCQGPSLTTYNVVKSYEESHPGQVLNYVIDDFGDTKCSSLAGWVKSKGLNDATVFSDASIDMSGYGDYGMPKIVVVGSAAHTIYYQAENSVNSSLLQKAINNALLAVNNDLVTQDVFDPILYPNPAAKESSLRFNLSKASSMDIYILNSQGMVVKDLSSKELLAGDQLIKINTGELDNGFYILYLMNEHGSKQIKFQVFN